MEIVGDYKVRIREAGEGYYLAHVTLPNGRDHTTQGTENDIFFMIGDLMACCYDKELSWWKRFIIKFFK